MWLSGDRVWGPELVRLGADWVEAGAVGPHWGSGGSWREGCGGDRTLRGSLGGPWKEHPARRCDRSLCGWDS